MALRTAKPALKVRVVPEGLKLTLYHVLNRTRVRGASVIVDPQDKETMELEVERLLSAHRKAP